ncbi:MAG: bacillithiol biosynthesis deacetylase BshB1 [Candidatus Latescibacterota bacterium]|nr:MAG: bacillithiol biosynthesis deacetylase BshB1 [Candidatus Latescibacterota bacterium]
MRIAAFGIHPDDVELGCGGTVILAARQGNEVTVVDLSEGRASSNGTPEERVAEAAAAAAVMGVKERINIGLPDTRIRGEDASQTAAVVACLRDIRPHVVITSSSDDPHPDHASGGRLIERALYLSGIHGYEPDREVWPVPHVLIYAGRREIEPHIVVDVTTTHATKIKAIRAHASQFVPGEGRKPTPLNAAGFIEVIEARSRIAGRMINVRFGEGFRTLKPVALSDLNLFARPTARGKPIQRPK